MKNYHLIDKIATILLLIGGLNWGILGLFHFNLVSSVFGDLDAITRIIYILVGLAAVYKLACWIKAKKK